MVTKTYLKPTYVPTYATVVIVLTDVTVVTVVTVVTSVRVLTVLTQKLISQKTFSPKKYTRTFFQIKCSLKKTKCDKTQQLKI